MKYLSDINKKNYYGYAFGIDKAKKRKEFQEQRINRGFDDTELWNLDTTTIRFFADRFKAFRAMDRMGYCGRHAALGDKIGTALWEKILLRIEKSLDWSLDDDKNFMEPMPKNILIGYKFLFKYFHNLWD